MIKSLTYEKPVASFQKSTINLDYWEKTKESYKNKEYKNTVLNLINYMDPDIVKNYGNKDLTEFNISHGSIVINMTIKEEVLTIKAPFLKLPEGGRQNALLRQIAEINFSSLMLSQIELNNDELVFFYAMDLELCEPYKVYDIFYEICIFADYYDDIFINTLGAERLQEMKVKEYSESDKEILWNNFTGIISEGLEHIEHNETKRIFGTGLDSARISLMKMDYLLYPQGKIVTDIQKALNKSYNNKTPVNELCTNIKKELIKLKEYKKDEFFKNMYIPQFLIQTKKSAALSVVKDWLKGDYEASAKYQSENNFGLGFDRPDWGDRFGKRSDVARTPIRRLWPAEAPGD